MEGDAQGLIIAAVAVTGVTTLVAQAAKGDVTFRPFLGTMFLGIFLTAIEIVSQPLARNFAMLIILVALLRNGQKTFSYVSGVNTPPATGKAKK